MSLITFKVDMTNLFHLKRSSGFTSWPVCAWQEVQNDFMTEKPPIVTSSDTYNVRVVPASQNRKFGRETKVMS